MSDMQPVPDPYRILGVTRAATATQIKGAHRALAKRYHPDSATGDAGRFLAVQEAYQILADPHRRREWDARNSPGPVRAGEGTFRGRASPGRGSATGRWTREGPEAGSRRGARSPRRPDAGPDRTERPDSSSGTYTWSAEGVPWWEDHANRRGRPGRVPPEQGGQANDGPAHDPPGKARPMDGRPAQDPPGSGGSPEHEAPSQPHHAPGAFDVYSRSSGAAWSSAARRYFRQGDAELPSRGAFRREGTQYVTGVRARRVADADARATSGGPGGPGQPRPDQPRPDTGAQVDASILRPRASRAAPRQAFEHDPPAPAVPMPDLPSRAPPTVTPPTARTPTAQPPIARPRQMPHASPQAAVVHQTRRLSAARASRPAAPDPGRALALAGLAWLPVAAVIGSGGSFLAGCQDSPADCPSLLGPIQAASAVITLVIFTIVPSAGRAGALALAGALAVAVPLVLTAVLLGLVPPAPPIMAAGIVLIVAVYLLVGGWALVQGRRRPPEVRLS